MLKAEEKISFYVSCSMLMYAVVFKFKYDRPMVHRKFVPKLGRSLDKSNVARKPEHGVD